MQKIVQLLTVSRLDTQSILKETSFTRSMRRNDTSDTSEFMYSNFTVHSFSERLLNFTIDMTLNGVSKNLIR